MSLGQALYANMTEAELLEAIAECDRILELESQLGPHPQAHQKPPDDPNWSAWVLAAGRGGGKSFASMLWLDKYAHANPGLRARVIAPTFADGVASCVEGPNGLLTRSPEAKFRASAPGGARVEYPNESHIWIVGTPTPRDVDRLRALTNIHVDVFEEAAANPQLKEAFTQAELSRRGDASKIRKRWVASTTPRPLKIMREWQNDPKVHYIRVPSSANKFVDQDWLQSTEKIYAGTRLYRQEIQGEILDDVEGAMFTINDLARSRVKMKDIKDKIVKVVVGVDPASGSGTTGVVVVGLAEDGHLYVLSDESVSNPTPNQWALAAINAARAWDAAIIVEINQGGRMATDVINTAQQNLLLKIPVNHVYAKAGKASRAEPLALMFEADEQTAHIVDDLPQLEDQMTTWVPDVKGMPSPDRLDAAAHAANYLRRSSATGPAVSQHANLSLPA